MFTNIIQYKFWNRLSTYEEWDGNEPVMEEGTMAKTLERRIKSGSMVLECFWNEP